MVHPKTTSMKVAIYARVSTSNKNQDTDNQIIILQDYCKSMAYDVYKVYADEVSGGTSERPQFKVMFADASKRRFDQVLFWSLDRFSREGTRTTIKHLEQLESYGVNFRSYTEQYIDTCGMFKDVVISLLSTLARQEKIRMSERVKAGLARSTKRIGRPRLDFRLVEEIRELKTDGRSNRFIAKKYNIGHSTVGRYLK